MSTEASRLWIPKAPDDAAIPNVGCTHFAFGGAIGLVFEEGLPSGLYEHVLAVVMRELGPTPIVLDKTTTHRAILAARGEMLRLNAMGRLRRHPTAKHWLWDPEEWWIVG